MEQKFIRVPFEIELAKRIQSGESEGRIVTRDGRNARVICWDRQHKRPIISLIVWDDIEEIRSAFINGKMDENREDFYDLMLEIPEYMTFKDGDILYVKVNNDNWYVFIYRDNGKDKTFFYAAFDNDGTLFIEKNRITSNDDISELRLATEEEKQKLIYALKSSSNDYAKEYLKRFFGIEQKKEYDFKPKDWVLGRDDEGEWYLEIFSHKRKNGEFACIGSIWKECIPYNDQTAHLLGTTEDYKEE